MKKRLTSSIEILLIEDNPGDIELTREALDRGKIINNLHIAEDGERALNFVFKRGEFAHVPTPDIILLDLNLPKIDGREVLQQIKQHHSLKIIPTIILSSSEAAEDVQATYAMHANCFISKPVTMEAFMNVITMIEKFWIDIVKLPRNA